MLVNQKIVSIGAKREHVELLIVGIDEGEDEGNGLIAVSDLSRKFPKRPTTHKIEYVLGKIKRKEWQIVEHDFPDTLYCKTVVVMENWPQICIQTSMNFVRLIKVLKSKDQTSC